MRLLNDKTLQRLCQRRRCTREGYLRMRRLAPTQGSEKRQYFRLCGNILYYLDRPQDDQPVGALLLAGHMVEPADDRDQAAAFCLSYQDAGAYQLTASSAEEAALWMHAIIGAAHECALSLADSLQEQLRSITLADAPAAAAAFGIGPAKAASLPPAYATAQAPLLGSGGGDFMPAPGREPASLRKAFAGSLVSSSSSAASAAAAEFSAALDRRLEAVYQLMLASSDRRSS